MRRDRDRRSASLLTRLNKERFFAGAAAFDWDSRTQPAETGWEDGVLRAGRGKMIQMLRESPDSLDQWGTLSPEYPDVEWHSKLIALRCMEGKRLEFRLVENRGTSSRELLLEYILPR